MNKFITSRVLLICSCLFAYAEEPVEIQHIQELSAVLQREGLSGLSSFIKENHWESPRIPSKWSIEHRPRSEEQQKVALAGREFGRELAVQLDVVAPVLQDLQPGDELNRRGNLLCDLSDWCASSSGYGNLLLAQRCLDLAAVGLARLTASLDFPLAECEKLASRMSPAWMSVEARARTLNAEAGTNLFAIGGTQADLEKIWGAGGFLKREKQSGISRSQGQEPGRGFIETWAIKANLDFFEREKPSPEPLTLLRSWDGKRFERIVNGLELQNVSKALALVKFRTVIGQFPEKIDYTENQLRAREEMRSLHEKLGVKANISNKDHVSGKAAFLHSWDQRKDKDPKDYNLDARAWQAYSEVKTGQFLDQDTHATQMFVIDSVAQ